MNLYIVESPLQLLCAYESISENNQPYKLLLRMTGRGNNDLHLINCAQSLDVNFQKIVVRTEKVKFDLLLNIFKILRLSANKYETVYLGSYYSNFLKIFKKLLKCDEIYYLDDGLATLRAQEEILKKQVPVNWYTFLNLEVSNFQKIEKHDFSYLKKISKKNVGNDIFFIGQPIEHMINFQLDDYINCIKKIVEQHGRLYYIPHRVENLEFLNAIENIEIVKLDYPIELYFLFYKNELPKKIYSCYSTGLITCNILFEGVECSALKINNNLDYIYQYMETSGVKVVDIKGIL